MSKSSRGQGQAKAGRPALRSVDVEATRARILLAARRLILRHGLRGLSIRQLAAQVHYAPGTIYLYFKNREAIARELCVRGYRELLARLQAVARPMGDPAANLHGLCTAYMEFGLAQPETYRLIFLEEPQYLAAVFARRPADDPATQTYQLLVDAARAIPVAGGARSKAAAIELAEACWAAMHGVVSLKLICPAFPTVAPQKLCRHLLGSLLASDPVTRRMS